MFALFLTLAGVLAIGLTNSCWAQPYEQFIDGGTGSNALVAPFNGKAFAFVFEPFENAYRALAFRYRVETEPGKLSISPESEYLDRIAAERPVDGVAYAYVPFEWAVPKLSIKLNNSTDHDVTVSILKVHVNSGTINRNPVPVFGWGLYGTIYFSNEGWGPLLATVLTFGFADAEKCSGSQTLAPTDVRSPIRVDIGVVEESYGMDLMDNLPDSEKERYTTCAVGELSYTDEGGSSRGIPFRTEILLVEPGPGAPAPPTADYSLFLDPGRADYDIELPLSQVVPAKGDDNFSVSIYSSLSADFDFDLKVLSIEDNIIAQSNVKLNYFLPRSMPKLKTPAHLYKSVPLSDDVEKEVSAYVSAVKQDPVNPRSFRFFITEDWMLLTNRRREVLHMAIIDSLVQSNGVHGSFCYINPEERCVRSGEF